MEPGTALGRGLSAEAAEAFGLAPGIPVGAGLIDAHAGAVGTMGASLGGEPADPSRRFALVRQIISDATGKRVAAPETSEPVLLGAAMLGAVAAGRHSMRGAMATMSRLKSVIEPAGGEIAALHAKKRRAFETLQDAERRMREAMR